MDNTQLERYIIYENRYSQSEQSIIVTIAEALHSIDPSKPYGNLYHARDDYEANVCDLHLAEDITGDSINLIYVDGHLHTKRYLSRGTMTTIWYNIRSDEPSDTPDYQLDYLATYRLWRALGHRLPKFGSSAPELAKLLHNLPIEP